MVKDQLRKPARVRAAKSRLTHSPSSGLNELRLGMIAFSTHWDIPLVEVIDGIASSMAVCVPMVSITIRDVPVESEASVLSPDFRRSALTKRWDGSFFSSTKK